MDFGLITAVLAALGSLFGVGGSSVRFVQQGERGAVLRFGKAVYKRGNLKVIEPGFCWIWPGIEKLVRTHVRQRVTNTSNQQITLKDDAVFTVDAVLVYRVGDNTQSLYRALFELENLDEAVRMYCIGVLREVVQEHEYRELINLGPAEIALGLEAKVREQLSQWGVEVVSFKLGDMSPYGSTLAMIQTSSVAKMRALALKQAASELGVDPINLPPAVAAALVGMPVAVNASAES